MALSGFRHSVLSPYSPASTKNFPAEYFAGVDVSIFFGDKYIDEIRDLEFSLEERIVPVYSYSSYTARKMVHGVRIIQGGFTINMRSGDYLHEMLYQDYEQAVFRAETVSSRSFTNIAPQTQPPNPFVDPDAFALWEENSKNSFWQNASNAGLTQTKDLSKEAYFQNAGFTILLVYGDIDTVDLSRNTGRVRTIEDVHPMRVSQMVSPSGENVIERWEFMATDMNSANRTSVADGVQM